MDYILTQAQYRGMNIIIHNDDGTELDIRYNTDNAKMRNAEIEEKGTSSVESMQEN